MGRYVEDAASVRAELQAAGFRTPCRWVNPGSFDPTTGALTGGGTTTIEIEALSLADKVLRSRDPATGALFRTVLRRFFFTTTETTPAFDPAASLAGTIEILVNGHWLPVQVTSFAPDGAEVVYYEAEVLT